MGERIIFLDFDGVIRVPASQLVLTPDHFDFCVTKINDLESVCEMLKAKVVVSSDWRNFENFHEIQKLLGPLSRHLHDDWMTPVIGHRWQEVGFWLMKHTPSAYVVLEDLEMHFEDACDEMKNQIIWCETNIGLTKDRISLIYEKFNEHTT